MLDTKYHRLIQYVKELGNLCVAYSGGVDSTFLLAVAYRELDEKCLAVTVRGSMNPRREIEEAVVFAKQLGVKHMMMDANEYNIKEFVENNKERCYYCKYGIFSKIKDIALRHGIQYVADGSNADDDNDYRPGMKAIKELKVVSPLKAVGLKKQEIRELSKEMGLPTWDKPSFACLASRIPYGATITREKLAAVEQAEEYLIELGFKQFRVRHHGEIARIEVPPQDRHRFFDEHVMDKLVKQYKKMGFTYVTLDLEGYRTGSMNETLTTEEKKLR